MKTITSAFTQAQEQLHTKVIKKIQVLGQYDGAITDRDSSTQIKVSGDATAIFNSGDSFTIPLNDFAVDYEITSSPTYSAGPDKTTIICSGAAFPTDIVDLEIARIYYISGGETERLVEGGISPIRFETEGETLNSFLADDVTIVCDNSEGFFYDKDGNGIFNIHNTNWIRVYLGYKLDTTRLLYFGGILPRELISPDKYKKQITFITMGFLKEMERYPGYEISKENGHFLKLKGVNIEAVSVPSGLLTGVFDLKYIWESGDVQGISIQKASYDTIPGIKQLKFIYPDKFVWDNGAITQLTEDTDDQTLTASDSSTITVDCTAFDVQSRETYVIIQNYLSPEIKDKGRAFLQFNNGQRVELTHDFQRVIRYDGASYTEETDDNNIPTSSFTALTDDNDALYLFSDKPFYGIEVTLDEDSDLSAGMAIYYSQGYTSWQTLSGFTDTTAVLTQNGSIIWDKSNVEGWRKTTLEPSGLTEVVGLYGIKIIVTEVSGSFIPLSIKRRIRLYGTDERTIDINYDFLKFDNKNLDEKLIFRQDESGNWIAANWYRNVPLYKVLDVMLDKTEILDANRNIDDLAITTVSNSIHLFGQAPMPFYGKKVTAAVWDSSRSLWWLGVQDELWTFSETIGFNYIDKMPPADTEGTEHHIINLAMDSGDYCQGIAYKWINGWPGDDIRYVFRADTGGIDTGTVITSVYGKTGKRQWRNGKFQSTPEYMRNIGYENSTPINAGENLTIPYPHILFHYDNSQNVLFDVDGLDSGNVNTGNGRFYFGLGWPSYPNSGQRYYCPPGHYFLVDLVSTPNTSDQGWLGFEFELGNEYTIIWDGTNNRWVSFSSNNDSGSPDFKIKWVDYQGNSGDLYDLYATFGDAARPLCFTNDGTYFLFAQMEWSDDGAGTKSPCKLYRLVSSSVLTSLFDFSGDSAEASQSITGREAYQTILDMEYNSNELTIHGCLLDRGNFEYHYFVYDVTNDKMYSVQLTDPHRQIVNFTLHSNEIYAMVVDRRYQEEGAYLIKGTFSGGTITLTEYDVINQNDYDHEFLVSGNNSLIGNTLGDTGVLWKYGTTFYPIIQYADFEDMDFREIVTEIAELVAFITWINSERKFNITKRETYDDTFTFYDDRHLLHDGLAPIGIWPHFYDYVEVYWESILDDSKGSEIAGTPGWDRRGLTIRNRFINDKFLAAAIAEISHDYFGTARETFNQQTIPILELEQRDRLNLVYSERRYDIDRSAFFQLTKLSMDLNKMILTTQAIGM